MLFAVPHSNDGDRVAFEVDAVPNDVSASPKRNHKLAIARLRGGTSPLGEITQGIDGAEQSIDGALRQGFAVRLEELSETSKVGSRASG